ncbi:hypothetical protein LXL04_036454 [Taraxacum kok-saghyz]
MPANPQKQLRRLPHIFSQILELPLRSHANVFIEDRSDCFQFTSIIEENTFVGQLMVHVMKIHPEVTKVVIRGKNGMGREVGLWLDKSDCNVWRYRLPETSQPELTTTVVVGNILTVTVPKRGRRSYGVKGEDVSGGFIDIQTFRERREKVNHLTGIS